jgi:ubiquinone/menaquinone biosynthesis C-methylase UbiE
VPDGIPSLTLDANASVVHAFFTAVAARHDGVRLGYVPWDSERADRQLRILSHATRLALARWLDTNSLVLDVGCGHGGLLAGVTRDYRIVGVDFVLDLLPFARERGYAVYHANAEALPFGDNQFDAVLCAEVLNQYSSAGVLLRELARVVKPGGSVIVSTLNRGSLLRSIARLIRSKRPKDADAFPVILRTVPELARDASPVGLMLREIAWVLSPTNVVIFSRRTTAPSPLATNFLIRFEKAAAA